MKTRNVDGPAEGRESVAGGGVRPTCVFWELYIFVKFRKDDGSRDHDEVSHFHVFGSLVLWVYGMYGIIIFKHSFCWSKARAVMNNVHAQQSLDLRGLCIRFEWLRR